MDSRLFYVLGDLFANIVVGIVVAWCIALVITPGWNMWIAMLLSMFAGMALATLLWIPIGILLGAMEVMVPLMFTGMASGMVVGMACAMYVMSAHTAPFLGAVCGLASIVFVWVVNNGLRGSVNLPEGPQL